MGATKQFQKLNFFWGITVASLFPQICDSDDTIYLRDDSCYADL